MEEDISEVVKIEDSSIPQVPYPVRLKKQKTWRKSTPYYAPDGGWSWLVLLGQFTISVLFCSVGPMFGIVFVHLVDELQLSSVLVAWIFNLQAVIWNMTAVMAGPLCNEFGWRPVAMVGSFIASTCMVFTCFATSSGVIFITFAVLGNDKFLWFTIYIETAYAGCGGSLAFSAGNFIVPHYFVAKRGFATAISSSGISFGSFILPLLVSGLQDKYGFHGASLIYSGIMYHSVIASMLFHPLKWHTLPTSDQEPSLVLKQKHDAKSFVRKFYDVAVTVVKKTGLNIASLKSPVVLILSVSGAVYVISFLNVMLMLPFALLNRGFHMRQVTHCLALSGAANLVARLVLPTLSDFAWFNKTLCYIGGILCVSASTLAFTFVSTYEGAVVALTFLGTGVGASMGLQTLILIQYKGLDQLPVTFGAFSFVSCIVFLAWGPIVGFIRDKTGSYDISNQVLGVVLFLSAAIWILMPCSVSKDKKDATSA